MIVRAGERFALEEVGLFDVRQEERRRRSLSSVLPDVRAHDRVRGPVGDAAINAVTGYEGVLEFELVRLLVPVRTWSSGLVP